MIEIRKNIGNIEMKEIMVSVVIPTYNCGAYIQQALESVLKQSVPLEVIIIDDASSDHTKKKLDKYLQRENIHYVKNEKNLGVCQSRNRGTALAKGKYIAFLDADDWWDASKLEKQLTCIQKNRCVLCFTGRELHDKDGKSIEKVISVNEMLTYKELLHHNSIACSSVLIKTSIAREFPMQHEEVHEDYLTWLRVLQKYGNACGVKEPLLKTRLTPKGKSRNKWKTFQMTYGVYRYLGIGKLQSFYYMGNHVVRSGLQYL